MNRYGRVLRMARTFLVLFLIVLGLVTRAAAQAPFYQGKTITIITGSQTGDLYDIYARILATHMPKHIPGNPNMLVQNMTERVISSRRITFTV